MKIEIGANLKITNLSGEDLRGANLCDANLCDANLQGANLVNANLIGADLRDANLKGANLSGADLRGADLRNANLCDTDLRNANLCDTNLKFTNLQNSSLKGANLQGASLQGANLQGASLDNIISNGQTAFIDMCCPSDGAFIGYKKMLGGTIAKLLIPQDALRSSATSRKCRASKVFVLEFIDSERTVMSSNYDTNFKYKLHEFVEVLDFDECRWHECTSGIHFFITKEEAINY